MKRIYDVAVIGGGIIGLSIAYHLLKENKKVLLIEKDEIGSGASGACDEMILLQSKKPGVLLEMALESLDIYKGLTKELKVDLEFQNLGGMVLIEKEQELRVMGKFMEKQRRYGVDVEILDKKDVVKKQPYVNEEMIGTTFYKMDSQINPLRVMRGFLTKGIALGLEIKKKALITKIKQNKDYWRIDFNNGEYVETQYIVNAAGTWAAEIGKMIDILLER